MNLDEKVNVELTVSEKVLLKNALRCYVEKLQGYIRDGLNKCDVAAAFIHEQQIAEAIETFGKLCEGEGVMGWTGRYLDFCPKGQERIMEAIKQEGYNFCEPDRRSRVIGSALVGSTVYLAVKYDSESLHCVYGTVILTAYDKNRGEFLTKGMSESMVPCSYDCPKRILDMLTPADDECAKEWRKLCAEKRAQKKPDDLAKLPEGTMIEINGFGGMWMIDKRKNRKVAINYGIMKYLPLSVVRKYGWNRK